MWHGSETIPMFLPTVGEASSSYFQVCSPDYHTAQCNRKKPILISSRCWSGLRKPKRININIRRSYHWLSSLYTNLNSSDCPQSVLTNLIGRVGVEQWSKKLNTYPITNSYLHSNNRSVANQGLGDTCSLWGKTDTVEL